VNPVNPNTIPSNHAPEDLAIWLFGACCGDNVRFAQLRLLARRAFMDASDMYGDIDTDSYGILETISRFNARLDELDRDYKKENQKDV